jgi:hypothetical protein
MKQIELSQQGKNRGKYFALVSDEDFSYLNKLRWSIIKIHGIYYAVNRSNIDGIWERIFMHRMVMNFPKKMQIDHKNGDGLDNRKENLRLCTNRQNCQNSRKSRKPTTSIYKGVCWDKRFRKWRSDISLNGKRIHLGLFDNETDAAHQYDFHAIFFFRGFENLNFPAQYKKIQQLEIDFFKNIH